MALTHVLYRCNHLMPLHFKGLTITHSSWWWWWWWWWWYVGQQLTVAHPCPVPDHRYTSQTLVAMDCHSRRRSVRALASTCGSEWTRASVRECTTWTSPWTPCDAPCPTPRARPSRNSPRWTRCCSPATTSCCWPAPSTNCGVCWWPLVAVTWLDWLRGVTRIQTSMRCEVSWCGTWTPNINGMYTRNTGGGQSVYEE